MVIDRTENFFYIDDTPNDNIANGHPYATGSSLIYGDDISYNVGKYKALTLNVTEENNKNLLEFLNILQTNSENGLKDFGYYKKFHLE